MNDLNRIVSADNEKVRLYRRLSEDRKLRRKEKKFTAEGARLVADAAAEAIELCCIFVTEDAILRYSEALELLLKHTDRKNINIITEEIAKSISDTRMSQGIFAICRIPENNRDSFYSSLKKGGRYLILDNIQDPGNMGTMLRTADACGIDLVITCSCCDIYNPKVIRSAMGSLMRVKITDDTYESAVSQMKLAGIRTYAAVIDTDATSLTECDFSQGGAVIIGNEGNGIPREHVDMADERLTIRMHGTINSLNAAMAAGIIMWELQRNAVGGVK